MACSSGTDAARSYPHKPQHRFVGVLALKCKREQKCKREHKRETVTRSPFLESPETFRAHFGRHNSVFSNKMVSRHETL